MPPYQLDEVLSGPRLRAAVVVAHPDDETLWCGGYILAHPEIDWKIVTLSRASDPIVHPSSAVFWSNWGQRVRWRIWMMSRARCRYQLN